MDLTGKRVVVTGAGSGIGQASAALLLDRGAEVVASDLLGESLAGLAERGAETLAADVSRPAGRQAIIDAAGSLTGLVCCAGLMISEPLSETDEETWDAIFDVNAKGVFFLCRDLLHSMSDGGSVVNLSSIAAKYSQTPEAAIYAASKAAVQCFTRTFAAVHGPRGVRVNCVCPGIISTPMQDRVMAGAAAARGTTAEALREARKNLVPLGREGEAEECARTIVALLSDETSYVTGQAINVCGGFQMY